MNDAHKQAISSAVKAFHRQGQETGSAHYEKWRSSPRRAQNMAKVFAAYNASEGRQADLAKWNSPAEKTKRLIAYYQRLERVAREAGDKVKLARWRKKIR